MWRWHRIHESLRPTIIEDYKDDSLYTLKVQDKHGRPRRRKTYIKRLKYNNDIIAHYSTVSMPNYTTKPLNQSFIAQDTWEGHFGFDTFKNVIINNVACVKLHKVSDKYVISPNLVVMFLTGDWNDVFLVCSKDIVKWDPHEDV